MERIWMAIAPSRGETRVLSTDGPNDTLLKARLCERPGHPRAVQGLIEALALWQRRKVHAVVVVDAECPTFAPGLFPDIAPECESTPLYTLDLAVVGQHRRRKEIIGLGDFRDLHRVLRTEVAR